MGDIASLDLGSARIYWLRGGRFRLDGGAMFGPVPKPLWNRIYPCDEYNSIPMQAAPLLVIVGNTRLLIDTGLGNKLNDKQRRIYRLEQDEAVADDLARLGLQPDDVDYVIMTHMDWDHSSGATTLVKDRLVPTFPRARFVIQRAEWEACTNPTSRTRHGYWPENWEPLHKANAVDIVDGETEVVEGVRLFKTGGHTHGHQLVRIDGSRGTLLHFGDIMPTHAHRNPLWVMGYDNFPLTTIEIKERWLPKAKAQGWWLSFYHDPFLLAAKLDDEGNFGQYVAGVLGWPPVLSSTD